MLTGSISQIKFWNKKSYPSQVLITSPESLDNYFKNQVTRLKCGSLPNQIQFNSLTNSQSLEYILSKKLRGVKLDLASQKLLRMQVKFINKQNYQTKFVTLEDIFDIYCKYRQKQLITALNSGQVSQQIIKPFLRIYSSVINNEYKLKFKQGGIINKQIYKLFDQILKQSRKSGKTEDQQYHQIQSYFRDTRKSTSTRVLCQADKILDLIQSNSAQKNKISKESQEFNYISNVSIQQERKTQVKAGKNLNSNEKKDKLNKCDKKLKFKQVEAEIKSYAELKDDYSQLMHQLGLLIEDTDKILKPPEDV